MFYRSVDHTCHKSLVRLQNSFLVSPSRDNFIVYVLQCDYSEIDCCSTFIYFVSMYSGDIIDHIMYSVPSPSLYV